MQLGFKYPIPMFPNYLFSQLPKSCQVVRQPSLKLNSIQQLAGDVRAHCTESWTLMASVLQFWTDEESIQDSAIFGGRICPVSALTEYVLSTINPHLEEGYKVTWEEVVKCMLWIRKYLTGDSALVKQIWRQPILLEGHSSDLEIVMEKYYNQELRCLEMPMQGVPKDKPASKSTTGLRRGQNLKLHLKRGMGDDRSQVPPKDLGPDVGKKYDMPWEEEPTPQGESQPQEGAGWSPLTNELLPLGENLTDILNYEYDQEVMEAAAHIPPADDIEMKEVNPPLGFDHEVGCSGYNLTLVLAPGKEAPGSNLPVTKQENRMLDDDTRAPGSGRSTHNQQEVSHFGVHLFSRSVFILVFIQNGTIYPQKFRKTLQDTLCST